LTAGKQGVTVVLLANGHSERLLPNKTATIQRDGCQPAGAVERLKRKLSKKNLDSLRVLHAGDRGGVGVLRRSITGQSPELRPMQGSSVLDGRPSFSWPACPGAVSYEVRLLLGRGAQSAQQWKTTSTKTEIKYPERVLPLPQDGQEYTWSVTAVLKNGRQRQVVQSAELFVLAEEEVKELKALGPVVAGDDPAGWLLAAALYESHGVYEEAIRLYEKAAKKRPEQGNIHRALERCYKRVGLDARAAAAGKQAEKVSGTVKKAE
jgi:tetratricopeptide (TPR) repeat protein